MRNRRPSNTHHSTAIPRDVEDSDNSKQLRHVKHELHRTKTLLKKADHQNLRLVKMSEDLMSLLNRASAATVVADERLKEMGEEIAIMSQVVELIGTARAEADKKVHAAEANVAVWAKALAEDHERLQEVHAAKALAEKEGVKAKRLLCQVSARNQDLYDDVQAESNARHRAEERLKGAEATMRAMGVQLSIVSGEKQALNDKLEAESTARQRAEEKLTQAERHIMRLREAHRCTLSPSPDTSELDSEEDLNLRELYQEHGGQMKVIHSKNIAEIQGAREQGRLDRTR